MKLLTTTPILLAQLTIIFLLGCLCITLIVYWVKTRIKPSTPYVNDKSEVDNLLDPKWDCEAVN